MNYLLWAAIGVLLAGIILVFQYLSVQFISTDKPSLSNGLIIGGAFIRFCLIGVILYFALTTSVGALLICFAALILSQMLFLFIWDHQISRATVNSQLIKKDI
jgi:hypothetical protein